MPEQTTKPLRRVYIDYNATAPLKPEVRAELIADMEIYGNASSMHAAGRLAHARIEQARSAVEKLLGAEPGTVVFTSGGSESNNTVFSAMRRLASTADGRPNTEGRNEFIITAIEHPCVFNSAKELQRLGFTVTFLSVDETGKINIDELKTALSEKTLLVSVMAANNEIGTIQDLTKISAAVTAAGAWMHTDAVQAVGKIPLNVKDLDIDYLTMSAHKIYGPKGVGALYVKKGAPL
ncbi:MAG: aminotransferase class V-fold PLP-dependent enzyme, partial [Treponema sp.]|nr:aminotransferase class V-fold PLP-dependent enzyme [Treponema sp.]